MAGGLAAAIHRGTAHLSQRVGAGSRGARALGSLVLRQAHSVPATCVCCANIHAVEGESVTEFAGRTVLVCEA